MTTIKDRLILGIADRVIERPRELQQAAQTNEHHVVHALYSLQKEGLTTFQAKHNIHSPGKNLTKIRLTERGIRKYKELKHG